eukprot:CAMPEP_0204563550 /NCGR_PEP_ID=MMETSP0661-20131031/34375_1 /ASSEMBLY_ACC=CAM_ASM_000606 /TAXON_ID=109239 /ORGANISM="Alexandrium margalefi, Strain AMGDE01CS-322" /LENGTH=103 /DNA_ID=CAMNT_0051571117 /DNA_START=87 /DNA_END=398 /DNA_ORIENTATION=+
MRSASAAMLLGFAAALLASTAAAFGLDAGDDVALFQTSITVNKAERVIGAAGGCDAHDPWGCEDEDEGEGDWDAHALYQTTVQVSAPEEETPRVLPDFDAFTL